MTNIVATILVSLSTNWTDTAVVIPFCNLHQCIHYGGHPSTTNQVGTVMKDTWASLFFEGAEKRVLLKSEPAPHIPQLKRDVRENIYLLMFTTNANWTFR